MRLISGYAECAYVNHEPWFCETSPDYHRLPSLTSFSLLYAFFSWVPHMASTGYISSSAIVCVLLVSSLPFYCVLLHSSSFPCILIHLLLQAKLVPLHMSPVMWLQSTRHYPLPLPPWLIPKAKPTYAQVTKKPHMTLRKGHMIQKTSMWQTTWSDRL